MSSGPTIKVHSDSKVVFSCTKPCVDTGNGKTAALVASLREAQIHVNQFLTELVVNGSQDQNQALEEDESSEEKDEEEEEDKVVHNENFKRKNYRNHQNSSNNGTTVRLEKRVKS